MLRVAHLHTWCVCVDSVELATGQSEFTYSRLQKTHLAFYFPFILETISISCVPSAKTCKKRYARIERVVRVDEVYSEIRRG